MIEKMLDWFHYSEPVDSPDEYEDYYSLTDLRDSPSVFIISGKAEPEQS